LINVRVKLYGTLRRQRPAEVGGSNRQPFTMQAPDGATVALILAELGVGQGYVGAVAVNGEAASVDSPLQDGDDLRLFPPSAGG
jgi:molybdopterin converting factor small subunit